MLSYYLLLTVLGWVLGLFFLSYLVHPEFFFSPPLFKLPDPVSVYLLRLFFFKSLVILCTQSHSDEQSSQQTYS